MNHKNTPRLETERLILRRFEPGDVDAVLAIHGDAEVMKFVPMYPLQSREEAECYLKDHYLSEYEKEFSGSFAICLKSDNIPIGYIHVSGEEAHDFGYGLRKEFWRQGITSEAGEAVLQWAKEAGVPFVTATHDVNNPRSGRVMQRLGMKYCYSYKELWQPKNFWVTFRMYQLNLDGESDRVYRKYCEMYEHFVEEIN